MRSYSSGTSNWFAVTDGRDEHERSNVEIEFVFLTMD